MKIDMIRLRPATALLLAAITLLALPGSATAGCLREFGNCGDCAEQALGKAIRDLDIGGIADAYVDGIDCDLDLMHCLVWGHHHTYDCGL